MPNEIYLILKTALTKEEFEKVEKYINTLQDRIDTVADYLDYMLPENEDAFYCQQVLKGKYDRQLRQGNTIEDISSHVPFID